MRVFRLLLLCALAYVVSVLFLFPAAPVIKRVDPQLDLVTFSGVQGKVINGSIDKINYDDGVFPFELSETHWRVLPEKLLSAALGVNFSFKAYGGLGDGVFEQRYNGDINLLGVNFAGPAKGLEALLPLPLATFDGQFAVQIEVAELRNQLLTRFIGKLNWSNAVLETPFIANLGNIGVDIAPVDSDSHRAVLTAAGGDLDISGSIDVKLNGDFSTDVLVQPGPDASAELLNALRGLGRADSSGRYRVQRNGNVNSLM